MSRMSAACNYIEENIQSISGLSGFEEGIVEKFALIVQAIEKGEKIVMDIDKLKKLIDDYNDTIILPLRKFSIPVSWTVNSRVYVEADSLNKAIKEVENNFSSFLPDNYKHDFNSVEVTRGLCYEEQKVSEMKQYTGMEVIKLLADLQDAIVAELGTQELGALITFDHNGAEIFNPFADETLRDEVDPIEYYGDNFLNSDWRKYL